MDQKVRKRRHPGAGRGRSLRTPKGRQVDEESLAEVQSLLGDEPRQRDLLIEYLHAVQDRYGALRHRHLAALAQEMGLAMAEVFEVKKTDRVSSEDMHLCLTKMEDRPWAEWARGYPITKAGIARKVKAFGVKPKATKFPDGTKQAHHRKPVEDAFKRYVPAQTVSKSATVQPANEFNGLRQSASATGGVSVALSKTSNPLKEK